jgi:hypothetical protein
MISLMCKEICIMEGHLCVHEKPQDLTYQHEKVLSCILNSTYILVTCMVTLS